MASKHSRCPTLTLRQQRFVEEYLRDCNGRQAAIRAGYSVKTAEVQASENLRIPNVQAALAAAMAARSQRTQITADSVLREIAVLAMSNIQDFEIDDHGNVGLRPGAPPEAMRAVQSLRKKVWQSAEGTMVEVELKLHAKAPPLRMAAEHLGLLRPTAVAVPELHLQVVYAPVLQQEA
jgi:phage terminase small subunit